MLISFLVKYNVYLPFTKVISNFKEFFLLIQSPYVQRKQIWFQKTTTIALPFDLP